jgi:nicotinamidase-related amidase
VASTQTAAPAGSGRPPTERGRAGTALIVIDMLNRYEHEDAEPLVRAVAATVDPISALIARARENDVPVVYVNDNYEDWAAGRTELCARALEGVHRELIEPLLPPAGSAFLTKARHSIFYETQLEYVLRALGVSRVVLTGQVTEQCILYSAPTPTSATTRS